MKQTISVVCITKGNDQKFLFHIVSNIREKDGLKNSRYVFYDNGNRREYVVEDCKGFVQPDNITLDYFILIREVGCEDATGKIRTSYKVEYEQDVHFSIRLTHMYKIGRDCSEDTEL